MPLTEEWLSQYSVRHPDFIVQEGLSQLSDLAKFNPSSINTIRIATYKSVSDNKAHFLNGVLRIGKEGSFVDNAHAGGVLVGIDRNGILAEYAVDQYGNKYESFNGIRFKGEKHIIPRFNEIIKFSESVGDDILHARLVAQDICIDADGNPRLIEFNIRAFGHWAFQYTIGPAFAEYTDEIIQYCVEHKKAVKKVIVEPF